MTWDKTRAKKPCHNVRGEDGPCDCSGCQDVAALLQRVEELERMWPAVTGIRAANAEAVEGVLQLRDDLLYEQERNHALSENLSIAQRHLTIAVAGEGLYEQLLAAEKRVAELERALDDMMLCPGDSRPSVRIGRGAYERAQRILAAAKGGE